MLASKESLARAGGSLGSLLSPRPTRVDFARTARSIDNATFGRVPFRWTCAFLVLCHFGGHHVTVPRGRGTRRRRVRASLRAEVILARYTDYTVSYRFYYTQASSLCVALRFQRFVCVDREALAPREATLRCRHRLRHFPAPGIHHVTSADVCCCIRLLWVLCIEWSLVDGPAAAGLQ